MERKQDFSPASRKTPGHLRRQNSAVRYAAEGKANFVTPVKQRMYSPLSTPESRSRRVLSRQFTYSEAKPVQEETPKAVDLLIAAFRKKKAKGSPGTPSKAPGTTMQTVTQRELLTAEKALADACSGITVKALNQLRGLTLPSLDMEKTFFAFLTLFAEVDESIEVGSNCKVMASRVWPAVHRYIQSPGQIVQTARKLPQFVHSSRISRAAMHRAADTVATVTEEGLRASARGDVGLLVLAYVRSAVQYYHAWGKASVNEKTEVRRTAKDRSQSPLQTSAVLTVSVTPLTPVETESDQLEPEQSHATHSKAAPSFGSEDFESQPLVKSTRRVSPLGARRESKMQEKLTRSKSQDDVRRSLSVLEMTVDWELDTAYRAFLSSKVGSADGHTDVFLHRESVLEQFQTFLHSVPTLQPHLDNEVAQTRIRAFISRLHSESAYHATLQSVLKPSRCR